MQVPSRVLGLTGCMVLGGIASMGYALHNVHASYAYPFWSLLILTVATARLKMTLPGLTGNMAVSLPFLLIAVAELSLLEALLIALPACVAQCLPKDRGKLKPIQLLFNLSTMAVAVAMANMVGARFAFLGALVFFLVQTISVAGAIRLTEGGALHRVWSKIANYSFPFYVLSAGVTMIVMSTVPQLGWQVPLLGLPVLGLVYRSYETYFGMSKTTHA